MEPKTELEVRELLDDHRKESNGLYAPMIVKTIVYGMVGLTLTTVFVAILRWAIK